MRSVIQRVLSARLSVDGKTVSEIGKGLVVYFGVGRGDCETDCDVTVRKIANMRIFGDGEGKMNRSALGEGLEVLFVSQFTLYGNCKKGRRPEFLAAARPEIAIPLYEKFIALCRDKGFHVETGEFGASMEVESVNDGPVTLIVDTDQL